MVFIMMGYGSIPLGYEVDNDKPTKAWCRMWDVPNNLLLGCQNKKFNNNPLVYVSKVRNNLGSIELPECDG